MYRHRERDSEKFSGVVKKELSKKRVKECTSDALEFCVYSACASNVYHALDRVGGF